MEPLRHAVLMGEPAYFSIRGGANPHTRGRWGMRKRADRASAIEQWHGLARTLQAQGVEVFVISANEGLPGLVYPANAGVLWPPAAREPAQEKCFYLSNLLPSRAGEQPIYAEFLRSLGIPTARLRARFEGEADCFVAGGRYLFTYGRILRQRFVPRLGLPPYRRIYGFRSEIAALDELTAMAGDVEIIPIELVDEAFYHGDTVLCSFGREREFLLANLDAIARPAADRLRHTFGEHMVALGDADAHRYAANSFALTAADSAYLFMPAGVGERLVDQVRECGVRPVLTDVSEFLVKGGGSVKCMIGDLGLWSDAGVDDSVRAFRAARRYGALFPT